MALLELDERKWLLRSMEELIARRGSEAFLTSPLLEPTDRYFPDPWEPSARGAQVLAQRLLTYAGIGELEAEVSTFSQPDEVRELDDRGGARSWGHEGAAAWFAGIDRRRCLFGVAIERLSEPERVVAAMCHEVAHAYRHFHGLAVEDRDIEERLTDATTVFLGFGILTTNGSYLYRASGELSCGTVITRWSHSRAGYLSPEAMSFLLAAQARARRMGTVARRRLAASLEANQSSFFKAAMRLLERGPDLAIAPAALPRVTSARPLSPMSLKGAAPEVPAPYRWNEGKKVYRVRRSKIGSYGLAGACVGAGAAAALGYATGSPIIPWLTLGVALAAGAAVGMRRRWDFCSDHDCEEILEAADRECPRCGGAIVGDLRSQPPRMLDDGAELPE
jgi:hypothetical protein